MKKTIVLYLSLILAIGICPNHLYAVGAGTAPKHYTWYNAISLATFAGAAAIGAGICAQSFMYDAKREKLLPNVILLVAIGVLAKSAHDAASDYREVVKGL